MLIIVGHGPSIVGKRLGPWIDKQRVVRLKYAERPNPTDWGTRTDYVCASSPSFWTDKCRPDFPDCEKWVLASKKRKIPKGDWRIANPEWDDYFLAFKPEGFPKPSTGLKAVFCAVEFLKPDEIGLIGFDRVLHNSNTSKWFHEQGKY